MNEQDRRSAMQALIMTADPVTVGPRCEIPVRSNSRYRHNMEDIDHQLYSRERYAAGDQRLTEIDADETKEKQKKEKKWSIGKLFRRKKKNIEGNTSSESEDTSSIKKIAKSKNSRKKKRPSVSNSFDHIVISREETKRAQSLTKNTNREFMDEGVLSDPSAGFIGYRGRGLPQLPQPSSSRDISGLATNLGGSDNIYQDLPGSKAPKSRKHRLKARVEAIRNSMRKDSSSDEESQKSSTSSSMMRFRSDDSLVHSKDGSFNKRSRSARTERYVKRLSRDEENQLNKEAELLQQGYTKAEVELLTRTPNSQSSGYGTSHRDNVYSNFSKKENTYANGSCYRPTKSESLSSFPSVNSYPSAINFNAQVNNENYNCSIPSGRTSINSSQINYNAQRPNTINNQGVIHVKFPLGNMTNMSSENQAPTPPPRDPHNKISAPMVLAYRHASEGPPNSQVYNNVPNHRDFVNGTNNLRRNTSLTLSSRSNVLYRPISTSEDHIAMADNPINYLKVRNQPRRPASVSAELTQSTIYANIPRNSIESNNATTYRQALPAVNPDLAYYAEQTPRSRKPINIQSSQNNINKPYISDSQTSLSQSNYSLKNAMHNRPRNATDFWRKIDNDECQRQRQTQFSHSRAMSDQTNLSRITPTRSSMYGIPQCNSKAYQNEVMSPKTALRNLLSKPDNSNLPIKRQLGPRPAERSNSCIWYPKTENNFNQHLEVITKPTPLQRVHMRNKSDSQISVALKPNSDEDKSSERRKSTNLDDALNELEAIYNSLGLGDEDLLDRAERRELLSPFVAKWGDDVNGNQIQADEVDFRHKHEILRSKRSLVPDKLQDDMAYRRLNSKDRPHSKDINTIGSQLSSYMLTSPAFGPYSSDDDKNSEGDRNEPDVIQDDVVFRNIKHANNHLKVIEPQPPFGIPLGPISPAPQSDYLHVTPENKGRPRFFPRRSPDIISDDLAYRSLRKENKTEEGEHVIDNSKELFSPNKEYTESLKKKRAVRSLSANIFSMIQQEIDDALNMSKLATLHKAQSISDVNKTLSQHKGLEVNKKFPNKVRQRHNTVNIYMPTHSACESSTSYPIHNYKTKPTDNMPQQPSESSNKYNKEEVQQVLNALAQEAMDTSDRLDVTLALLDKDNTETHPVENNPIATARSKFLNLDSEDTSKCHFGFSISSNENVDRTMAADFNRDLLKLHSNEVKPGTLDSKLSSTPNKSRATEDSLLTISDQLNKVENKLKNSYDCQVNFIDESLKLSSIVVQAEEKVKNQVDDEKKSINNENKSNERQLHARDINVEDQNYENPNICLRMQAEEIDGLTTFNELRQGISELLTGITRVNEKLNIGSSGRNDKSGDLKPENPETSEYNSSEELATIFQLDKKEDTGERNEKKNNSPESHGELNSPRLVKSANQSLRKISTDRTTVDSVERPEDNPRPSHSSESSKPQPEVSVPWRKKRPSRSDADTGNRDCNPSGSPKSSWYGSTGTFVLACSYSLLCTQQLAGLDWLTILGLILAMITVVAMLII